MQKSVLFLTINPPKASTKQRILDSLDYLRDKGLKCDVMPVPDGFFGRAAMMARISGYGLVCVQKKLVSPLEIRLMKWLNPRLVYDVDDSVLFHEVERSEPLTGRYFRRFLEMVGCSSAVMVGNSFLYEFARYNNSNVHIVPTPVNVSAYTPKDYETAGGEVTVGWMGTPGNLKYVKAIAPALRKLAARYPDMRLKIISSRPIEIDGVRVINKAWSEEDHVSDLRSLDIGLMPLVDDIWARGKCGNKILQYFAVGVPAVASPVGVNAEIIEQGVDGFLAATEEDWVRHISALIEDRELRMRMGMTGREKVLREYSQEVHRERLYSILSAI